MSTPSTVTATLPQHHHPFSHYQNYQPSYHVNDQYSSGTPRYGNAAYSSYGSSASELRRAATSTSRPSQSLQLPPIQTPHYSSEQYSPDMQNQPQSRERKKPDWNDFYKHGIPKEVIVIDDTPEPEPQASSHRSIQPSSRSNNGSGGASRPAEKRRKTGANTAYDTGFYDQHYSSHASHHDHSSSNNTVSTDRTTSAVNTTAPTSLGSQASNGTHLPPLEDGVVGQKRKRTRQAAQVEAKESKRRELERAEDPYSAYIPPPFPPRKAKDVYVQVIQDVYLPRPNACRGRANTDAKKQKSYTKDQNVDDDDGHYIVVPEADLTDRCRPLPSFATRIIRHNKILTLQQTR